MRLKTCKNKECKKKFEPERDFQAVCCFECSIAYSNQQKQKREENKKKDNRKRLREYNSKDKTSMKQKAQSAFNSYIRERDKGKPCISCGCKVVKGDASHFYSVGSFSQVRFNVDNVHLSCYKCNRFLHGNLSEYRPRLIKKIGQDRFDKLTELSNIPKQYNSSYYQRIIDIFTKKKKKLKY